MTQGLDVDVAFDGIDKFKGISARESGELSVFDFAGVELVHGWLADQGNEDEYEALMRAGSYEGAQEMIVAGLEAETKAVGLSDRDENSQEEGLSEEDQQAMSDCESGSETRLNFICYSLVELINPIRYRVLNASSAPPIFPAKQLFPAHLPRTVRALGLGTGIGGCCTSAPHCTVTQSSC